jgi:hypothetical protein
MVENPVAGREGERVTLDPQAIELVDDQEAGQEEERVTLDPPVIELVNDQVAGQNVKHWRSPLNQGNGLLSPKNMIRAKSMH